MVATARRRLLIDHGVLIGIPDATQAAMLLHDLLLLLTGRQRVTGMLLLLLLLLLLVILLRVSIVKCVVLLPAAGHWSVLLRLHRLVHQPRVG